MRVNKPWMIEVIKRSLGHPTVKLEITDPQIDEHLKTALLMKLPYYYGTSIIQVPYNGYGTAVNLTEYGVHEVIHIWETSATWTMFGGIYDNLIEVRQNLRDFNFINHAIFSARRAEFDRLIDRNWKFVDGMLYIDDFYGQQLAIECIKNIEDVEDITDEEALAWILKYALALTKISIGSARRKYSISNGPFQMDGETLVSEGTTEKAELDSQLRAPDSGFFFVMR